VSARLNVGGQDIESPAARLDAPGFAVVGLSPSGQFPASWLSFTDPADARELAAAIERAAQLLEGPQVTEAT